MSTHPGAGGEIRNKEEEEEGEEETGMERASGGWANDEREAATLSAADQGSVT